NEFAIDANFLLLRIDPCSQFGDGLPVYIDAPFQNELFAMPAAANASGCQNFLQAHAGAILLFARTVSAPPYFISVLVRVAITMLRTAARSRMFALEKFWHC